MKTPELSKTYEPRKIEGKIYQLWQKSGFFNPDNLPGKRGKSFTIVLPPPNITGELHMGHALNTICQDAVVRKKRMEGFKTLWLPGTDHAGIATQNVVEKELKKEGKTRFDLGREKFIERIWVWKEKYGNLILEQLKKLGASCDWSRIRFTMDKEYAKAVEEAFLHYYRKGLIYQGEMVVNWCPRCRTSLSDLELEYQEEQGKLWYIKYPLKKGGFVTVATTRPETMLGDTAVAVNPRDKRYKNLIGEKIILPIQNREIPLVSDQNIDLKFGTGCIKVTPAHDLLDWEIKERNNLETVKIIDESGKMTEQSKICKGLSTSECREKVLIELEKQALIEKTEDYIHSLPYCDRCHSLIELIPSKQWFLKMKGLARDALSAVKSGKVKFYPKNFEKIYFSWMENIRDWCISRQLWWGHKIPLENETDVLDTWFSSALWPFATLGWPKKTNDLKNFYPTNNLFTARDIINLWVARMIFSGKEFMGKNPFEKVFIHPTVLTKDGKRMSKSLGTGINPIGLCEKYGTDAVRFGLFWQVTGGQDMRFTEDNIAMGKKFCNKLWNASRFVLMQVPDEIQIPKKPRFSKITGSDKKILKTLEKAVKATGTNLDKLEFGKTAQALYDFFWHDFCDVYIEKTKQESKEETKQVLFYVLFASLKLLHPFIPFVTEEIYQQLPLKNKKECLMIEDWPK
jgi:valyl-tRNA synthetase